MNMVSASLPDNLDMLFLSAMEKGDAYPVFQPVVRASRQLTGFELLIRWNHENQLIRPDIFLPHIRYRETWVALTLMMLDVAVQEINEYNGRYSFAVNIPVQLGGDRELVFMMTSVLGKLLNPLWSQCIVLEYPETIRITVGSNIHRVAEQLQALGVRLYLDDCYSESSVFFPIRQVSFDGYKLDKRIIDSFQNDPHDMMLIRTLIFYTKLSGAQCVAEGIDTNEKFYQLCRLGVENYQGYFFSPPVTREQLPVTIRKLT
ncbi:EAL domain-containing protein [Citrobacter portucalensis]|uniref:EAL domain-containing protein n=1 Tax=Citrobacter portucalensis TaxID=1639133 RepID=UPI00226BB816|nr:EAL domain-containing protein [Citrobacter portucalensis]MCX8981029.1 EAL domain-containing protein [Citrobacter portucalensis]